MFQACIQLYSDRALGYRPVIAAPHVVLSLNSHARCERGYSLSPSALGIANQVGEGPSNERSNKSAQLFASNFSDAPHRD